MATPTTGPVAMPQQPINSVNADLCGSARTLALSTLPNGFPVNIDSPLAWAGDQFAGADYVLPLTVENIGELETALENFKAYGLDGNMITTANFVLPTLGKVLAKLSEDIHEGKGFGLVRGLDVAKYSVEDLTMIYLGVQSHIGDRRGRQDKIGNMLIHIVADSSTALKSEHHRHSTNPITFHNEEACDVVGWLVRGTASTGGKSVIASAITVYNVLAATRPDIVRALARSDWPFALPRFSCRPVLYFHEGKMMMNFGRTPLVGNAAHPRPAHLPGLNARQVEALDAIEEIARATEFAVATEAGDMLFINNLAVLHRRTGFVDGTEPGQKRHLVRMRIRSSAHGWSIPAELQRDWADAFEGDVDEVWHLDPMPDAFFPLRKYAN